ncbi:hypothetical protein RFI_26662 [Reticulomyxa filosa]|uniref:Uncharacterized protein n=1 Tax=Reticulomyxa filosa TaxID=46433 RepID=X6M9N1_RETFI|nr:hypothetical protein RFI_26662 [Reticulomyxa filosa]|eukprot:ETO10713.1 hypothetical protein RFI_26662 [Reticulomyxa filosa]
MNSKRDEAGRFLLATVVEKLGSQLRVHYEGWSSKWDVTSDYTKEINRFASARSISSRPAHRLQHLNNDDWVDIFLHKSSQWVTAQIKRKDQGSGQVQVSYELDQRTLLVWMHLDDVSNVVDARSKTDPSQVQSMYDYSHLSGLDANSNVGLDTGLNARSGVSPIQMQATTQPKLQDKTAHLLMDGKTVQVKMKELTLSELQDLIYEHVLKDKTWNDQMMLQIRDSQNNVVQTDKSVINAIGSGLSRFTLDWVSYG